MKIKEGYILREVAGTNVVVNTKEGANLGRMITLNASGAYIWKLLENECTEEDIISAMLSDFDADADVIKRDVNAFIAKMREAGIIE